MSTNTQNTPNDEFITQERLDKAIELYGELAEMDNSNLRQRVHHTLKARAARRRKIVRRSCAAVLLPLAVAAGLYVWNEESLRNSRQPQVWSSESVVLTLSDGSAVTLDNISGGQTVADDNLAVFNTKDGYLAVERKSGGIQDSEVRIHTIYVPKGKQYDMVLEDGTHVWLNSDSYLKFPSVFNEKERRVSIEGEVYFEVAPNATRAFIVDAGSQTLTVLGTKFDISAYPEDAVITTTLVSGSVSIAAHGREAMMLNPNEQAEFDRNSSGISVKEINAADVVAWKEGYFAFDENTLEQVLNKLSRWYDIEVTFKDTSLKDIIFKGTLPKYDDVSKVLGFIERSGDVKFEIKGNRVIVKK